MNSARQHLDRDVAPELGVVRPVDLPHPAGAEQGLEPVVAEHLAGPVIRRDIVAGRGNGKGAGRQEAFLDNRVLEQHFDLTPKVVVVGTRLREEACTRRRVASRPRRDTALQSASSVQASSAGPARIIARRHAPGQRRAISGSYASPVPEARAGRRRHRRP